MRTLFYRLAWCFTLLFIAGGAHASITPKFTEGKDYLVLQMPQPVTTGKKIEVQEFFWYRCPHCFHLQPALMAWEKRMPKDAQMVLVPVAFNAQWLPAAKLFYALKDTGDLARLHSKVFDAYQVQLLNLDDPTVLKQWVAKEGINVDKFMASYNSFDTLNRAMQGTQQAKDDAIQGVPTLVIDGKYLTSPSFTNDDRTRLFQVVDYLIAKAQKERGRH